MDEYADDQEGRDEDNFFRTEENFLGAVDDDADSDMDDTGNQGVRSQGVRKSRRSGRGTTSRYKDYELLTDMRQKSACRATIRDGVMCFLAQDVEDAEPMAEEDCDEFALGVALSTYGLGAGIKKFGEKGLTSVRKELKQMACGRRLIDGRAKVESNTLPRESEGEADQGDQDKIAGRRKMPAWSIHQARNDIAHSSKRIRDYIGGDRRPREKARRHL